MNGVIGQVAVRIVGNAASGQRTDMVCVVGRIVGRLKRDSRRLRLRRRQRLFDIAKGVVSKRLVPNRAAVAGENSP